MQNDRKKARVFVVDDNEVVRRVMSGIVRQDETLLFVGEAANGELALGAIKLKAPDVVCLDMMMPGIDGMAVLDRLPEVAPSARAVMITGYPTADLVGKARELGVAAFVVKPFNAATVLAAIHAAAAAPAPIPPTTTSTAV